MEDPLCLNFLNLAIIATPIKLATIENIYHIQMEVNPFFQSLLNTQHIYVLICAHLLGHVHDSIIRVAVLIVEVMNMNVW